MRTQCTAELKDRLGSLVGKLPGHARIVTLFTGPIRATARKRLKEQAFLLGLAVQRNPRIKTQSGVECIGAELFETNITHHARVHEQMLGLGPRREQNNAVRSQSTILEGLREARIEFANFLDGLEVVGDADALIK